VQYSPNPKSFTNKVRVNTEHFSGSSAGIPITQQTAKAKLRRSAAVHLNKLGSRLASLALFIMFHLMYASFK
jgi:hypothetical protein